MVDHVRRILAGESIYGRADLDFVPFIYTPLYYYVSAGLAAWLGVGFLPLRLVSLAASVGCLLLLYLYARKETGSRGAGLLAAGLFAATYALTGGWLDLARVDSLFLCLLLAGVYLLRPGRAGLTWAAGVLLALAFLAKQTALIAGVPVALHAVLFRPRRETWGLVLASVSVITVSTTVLELLHPGHYLPLTLLPAHDPLLADQLVNFWTQDLIAAAPLACLLAVLGVALRFRLREWEPLAFDVLLAAGTLGASWLSRLRTGGYPSVVLPAYACLALLAAIAASRLPAALRGPGGRSRAWLATAVPAACLLQLGLLAYNPARLVPNAEDRRAGEACVRALARVDGEVLVPFHAYLAGLAGKRIYLSGNAGADVFRGGYQQEGYDLYLEILGALRERRFAVILLDDSPLMAWTRFGPLFREEIEHGYEAKGPVFDSDDAFWPVSGARTRPETLLVRRPPAIETSSPPATRP